MGQDQKKHSNHSSQYMKTTLQKYTYFSNIYIFRFSNPASGILQQLLSLKTQPSSEFFHRQFLAKALLISTFGMLTK